jgi:DNA-binding IclR family transcriptional regulator
MKLNRAILRIVEILELISKSRDYLSLSEISRLLKIPKSSAFELLYTLVETGMLDIADERLKTFKLGVKTFTIGSAFLKEQNITDVSRSILTKLMEMTNETVFLGVENNREIVYLDKLEPQNLTLRPTSIPGSTNPLTCTGIGKAILAAYTNNGVRNMYCEQDFVVKTKFSISNIDDLICDLEKIRKRGYATDDRESEEEMFCLAVPIYNYTNKPAAAVSISGLAHKNSIERENKFSELLIKSSLEISRKLGFTGNNLFN